jgi:hypothetical protein
MDLEGIFSTLVNSELWNLEFWSLEFWSLEYWRSLWSQLAQGGIWGQVILGLVSLLDDALLLWLSRLGLHWAWLRWLPSVLCGYLLLSWGIKLGRYALRRFGSSTLEGAIANPAQTITTKALQDGPVTQPEPSV